MKMLLMAIALSTLFFLFGCGNKTDEKPEQVSIQSEQQTNQNPEVNTNQPAEIKENAGATNTMPQAEIKSADLPTVESTDISKAPISGKVVSLNEIAAGNSGEISVSKAGNAYDKGQVLGFKSGDQIYIVYNEDGTFAGKRLHSYIGKTLKISGEIKKFDELVVLIAYSFE